MFAQIFYLSYAVLKIIFNTRVDEIKQQRIYWHVFSCGYKLDISCKLYEIKRRMRIRMNAGSTIYFRELCEYFSRSWQ